MCVQNDSAKDLPQSAGVADRSGTRRPQLLSILDVVLAATLDLREKNRLRGARADGGRDGRLDTRERVPLG